MVSKGRNRHTIPPPLSPSPAWGSSGGQKPSSSADPINKPQKGLSSPTPANVPALPPAAGQGDFRAPQPDRLALRLGPHGQQGPQGSAPIAQLVVRAIPTGRHPGCPNLEHGAGSNPAGHPGSGTLSSWPSHPAGAPLPATDRAPRCGVPWPQWAGGHPLAQPSPPLPHQAHRQGVACHSSPLRRLNKTKLVTGSANLAQG